MRWCSRCAAVGGATSLSTVLGAIEAVVSPPISVGASPKMRSPEQAASASAAAISAISVQPVRCTCSPDPSATSPFARGPFPGRSPVHDDLDLLRPGRLDPRAAALLDPPPHHHAPAGEPARAQPGLDKLTLVPFQNRNGEVLAPAPPEIDVNGAAALAHRHHFSLDQCEATPLGREPHRVLGLLRKISRI